MKRRSTAIVLAILFCNGAEVWAADNGRDAQRYFEEGEKAISENRLDAASQAYEQLARINPAVPEVRAKLGLIYYMQRRYADAVPQLREAVRLNPALPNAGTLLAISYAELGRYNEAVPGLEKAFRHSSDAKLRRLTGLHLLHSYIGLAQRNKAVHTMLELSDLYPDDPEILYDMAHLFGDVSYSSMKRLSAVAPDSVWVLEAAGEKYEAAGAYDAAIVQYRKVIALDPARADIHFRLGHALLGKAVSSGDKSEALAEFQKEYELTGDSNAAYEIGEIYRRSGENEKARQYFGIALKDRADFEEAQVGLARVLLQSGQPAEALPHLQQALKINPESEVSHYQMARAYSALGNPSGKAEELSQFRRLRQRKQVQQALLFEGQFQLSNVTRQTLDPDAQ